MVRAEVLQGVRQMRFEGLLERHERGELSQEEAAEMLGVSERTFRRWRDRLRDEGPEGLRDRRIGKPSSRRAAAEEILRMLGLYQDRYAGFTVKHFHEQLQKRHNYKLGYTVTRLALQGAGLVRPAPRRSAHRKKRPRRAMVGMMLHQDASRFAWLPGEDRQYDLVVTLDDATSAVYSGFIVGEEGTASSFRALAEVISQHGLFCELYTDRGSHYFHTPKAGEAVSKTVQTQVGRALAQLGIRHIAAYSPEARGLLSMSKGRARLPHLAGPAAEGVGAGRHHHDRGGQSLARRDLLAGPQCRLCGGPGASRERFCRRPRRPGARDPVPSRGAPGRQRQHRQVARSELADPAEPAAGAFCARHGARARIPRRAAGDLPRAASAGRL
ncbi:MAG: helix-turn-helix domain-containing protein [Stellaceae bacterium]